MDKVYDLLIIGSGPAGYTASIYASRYKIDHLVIGQVSGGQVSEAHRICNFPSLPKVTGMELTQKIREHVKTLGAEEINDLVTDMINENGTFKVKTQGKKEFETKTILLSIGTERRKLDLPNEDKFIGKGVSYCATCDGGFFKDKVVSVVGGSDAANTASLYLAEVASQVYQIYRKDKLRGEPSWVDQIKKNSKIKVIYNANVSELIGSERLEEIKLDTGEKIKTDGLFIEIGSEPNIKVLNQLTLELSESNYIKVDQAQKTNISGVWAAGDITTGSNGFQQIVTACAEGAIAVEDIFKFLQTR
jgi:thioredoxin reductase (NADPH)